MLTWHGFWLPFLISSVGGSAISAVVGYVMVTLAKRWWRTVGLSLVKQIFGEEQERTTAAVAEAAESSRQAAKHAATAGAQAKTAGENSRQVTETLEWFIPYLAERDAVIEQLRERIDRLLGTRARELAAQRIEEHPGLLVPFSAGDLDDPTSETGRHRLHRQRPTNDQGDPT